LGESAPRKVIKQRSSDVEVGDGGERIQ